LVPFAVRILQYDPSRWAAQELTLDNYFFDLLHKINSVLLGSNIYPLSEISVKFHKSDARNLQGRLTFWEEEWTRPNHIIRSHLEMEHDCFGGTCFQRIRQLLVTTHIQ